MTALLEDPTYIVLFGLISEVILGVVLVMTGRGVVLGVMGGVLALTLLGLGVEVLVVTERERIEMTVEAIADAVAADDQQGVLAHIDPESGDLHHLVVWGFQKVDFTDARITHIEIDPIDTTASPPTATIHVKGLLFFTDPRGEIPYERYLINLDADLRRESDGWIVFGCKVKDDPRH